MRHRDQQSRANRRNQSEASYDEASRARYRVRASRPGGTGEGGSDRGLTLSRRVFVGLMGVMAARLAWLQIIDAPNLAAGAREQTTNKVTLHAKRGTIYDRNGNALAVSVECQTIYANPKEVSDPSGVSNILMDLLGGEKDDYMDLLTQDTTFIYIERQVDQEIADRISDRLRSAGLVGVYFLSDMKRVYPYGNVGSQIVGFVGVDGEGLSGLELYYDDVLTGVDGEMLFETGRDGTPVAGGATEVIEAVDGTDLVLGLDVDIQENAERIIEEAVKTYSATSGSIMLSDPRTGEIIAACSTPLADLSNLTDYEALNLKLVSSTREPGSIFKVITTSIGIENGLFDKDTVYYVPARVLVGSHYVTDVDYRSYDMEMSVTEMMRRSSNTAMAMLAQDVIGAEAFSEGIARFGIGQKTGIDFPGEVEGLVRTPDEYDGATLGSMGFGQGLAFPMVQIVRAYGAVANGGKLLTPHFVTHRGEEEVKWPKGETIISEDTREQEIEMMRIVMTEGTGTNANVDGYEFVGKTGTGEQAAETGGYLENSFVSSVCGFANADDPQILVYVGLDGTPYHSSESSAHAFHDIAQQACTILGIQPSTNVSGE